jgi:hypothetical protein
VNDVLDFSDPPSEAAATVAKMLDGGYSLDDVRDFATGGVPTRGWRSMFHVCLSRRIGAAMAAQLMRGL